MLRMIILSTILLVLVGCGQSAKNDAGKGENASGIGALAGKVRLDGSSTVFPISEAAAEEFGKVAPRVRVTVGVSGTGGGFKKFLSGETDINDASRPIKTSENDKAKASGLTYLELPIAFDGLSVVVNVKNTFVDYLTVEELNRIWMPGSQIATWQDVRPEWPAETIRLYGPATDSGTFDYFTEVINGKEQASRADFTASEDDNMLVQGISGDVNALGYFGYAYFLENREILRLVPVDGGEGPVMASAETINDGSYQPLSRPIFIYVNAESTKQPQVLAFVEFYLDNAPRFLAEVGYIPLPDRVYQAAKQRVQKLETGSSYHGDTRVADLLAK